MDFRTNRSYKINDEASVSHDYGIFDNLVFVGNHPLSDSEIAMTERNIESVKKSKTVL